LKSFIAIFLAAAFLFQSASKLLIMADYELHKDFITKNFCENKAKPMMHCNGKCHMRKQLQKEDKKENSTSNNIREKFELQFCSVKKEKEIIPDFSEKVSLNIHYLFNSYCKHLLSVFHPPQSTFLS
jgi:hypothetical protein